MQNAATVGEHLMGALRELQNKHPIIGDVRGRGLMIGVELVRDRKTKERAVEERNAVVQAMFRRGVLILGAGRNAIRFAPPLVLTKDQADAILRIFDESLDRSHAAARARATYRAVRGLQRPPCSALIAALGRAHDRSRAQRLGHRRRRTRAAAALARAGTQILERRYAHRTWRNRHRRGRRRDAGVRRGPRPRDGGVRHARRRA